MLTVGNKMFEKEYAVKFEMFQSEKYELENSKNILNFTIL